MTHIKTFYGDGGTLKVTLIKNEKKGYNVFVKGRKTRKSKWKILKYYSQLTLKRAKDIYRKVSIKF